MKGHLPGYGASVTARFSDLLSRAMGITGAILLLKANQVAGCGFCSVSARRAATFTCTTHLTPFWTALITCMPYGGRLAKTRAGDSHPGCWRDDPPESGALHLLNFCAPLCGSPEPTGGFTPCARSSRRTAHTGPPRNSRQSTRPSTLNLFSITPPSQHTHPIPPPSLFQVAPISSWMHSTEFVYLAVFTHALISGQFPSRLLLC